MSTACSAPAISPGPPPPVVYFPGDAFETSTVNFQPLPERRREVRYPTYEEVKVSLIELSGLEVSGVLRDVSRSGFRVDLALPVRTGARVKVSIRDQVVIFATARYCRKEKDTFQVGASIDAMFCPSALLAARAPSRHSTQNLHDGPDARNSEASGCECRDLARAIIADQKLFLCGSPEPLGNRRSAADRTV